MEPINQADFDRFIGDLRQPIAALFTKEIGWFKRGRRRGIVLLDRIDKDYSWILFNAARNLMASGVSLPTPDAARAALFKAAEAAGAPRGCDDQV